MFKVGDRVKFKHNTNTYDNKWFGEYKEIVAMEDMRDMKGNLSGQWLGFICPDYDAPEYVQRGRPNFSSREFELYKPKRKNFPKQGV